MKFKEKDWIWWCPSENDSEVIDRYDEDFHGGLLAHCEPVWHVTVADAFELYGKALFPGSACWIAPHNGRWQCCIVSIPNQPVFEWIGGGWHTAMTVSGEGIDLSDTPVSRVWAFMPNVVKEAMEGKVK